MTATLPDLDQELAIDAATADALFFEARTANTFSDEPVSEETARAIYELAKMGPTMMNNQPMRVTWVRSAAAREQLAHRMAEGNRAKTLAAPLVAVLSFDADWHEQFPVFLPHAAERQEMFDGEEKAGMRESVGKDNAHLQAGYFIMAVRAVGLHAGPMGGFDAAGVDEDFHAGTSRKAFMVVNIGKPGENPWYPRLPRLDYATATTTL
ncbi:malonic semialdehyde reductase [Arthrobacter sp. JSM 101049]|uniref:malonic semialdehyde reductase n=1 Tax=Arthrobacter sp. JSM 101049 TaxID=929097 RepID=UPI00356B1A74